MDKSSKIGIFDSGIGGVTVLKEIVKVLPNENYIYYSDSLNCPYGGRTGKEIINLSTDIVEYFIKNNSKVIVIACNTITAIAIDYLRNNYPNMIFIGIEPAYKVVHDFYFNQPTLIMATEATFESEKFNILYNKYKSSKTYLLPCTGLADMIENSKPEEIHNYLEKNLSQYKGKVDNIVLGCTHYPLIKNEIINILGDVNFFDGSYKVAVHLKQVLEEFKLLNSNGNCNIEFIDSSNTSQKKKRFFDILNKNKI